MQPCRNKELPQIKIRQRGFGLLELVIGLAITGICAYTVLILTESVVHQQAISREIDTRKTLISILFTLGDRATPTIRFEDFRASQSLWRSSDPNMRGDFVTASTLPTFGFKAPVAHGGQLLYRNSWTLDMSQNLEVRRSGSNLGFLMSRCIPKADATLTQFDLTKIGSYDFFPVLTGSGETTQINCCKISGQRLSNCKLYNKDSQFRLRLFHGTAQTLKFYPQKTDWPHINGAGFYAFFNKGSSPDLLTVQVFSADNECLRVDDLKIKPKRTQCDEKTKVETKIIERTVISNVHDSGIMRLGR